MLRYFYIIVCIQVCFCSVYVDNNDYEILDRRVRCRTTKLLKKQTRSPRKSKVVQFDVQKFMRTPDSEAVEDHTFYGSISKKRLNRLVSANDADFVEAHESAKARNENAGFNTRSSPDKYQNPRHFNFYSHAFDDDKNVVKVSHGHKKATSSFKQNKEDDGRVINNPEKKCSFRNMKIPFFSRNKATVKSKRHKKRRIFCFNCVKKTTTTAPLIGQTVDIPDVKTDDFNKDNPNIPSVDDKTNTRVKISKVSKRAYEQLCPKCIRQLLINLKKKTTKKVLHNSTAQPKSESKSTTKKRTSKQKADLSDSLQDGYYEVGSERLKRNEDEEQERERRLKELEEVEKKIENVHITSSTLTRNLIL